ncbi:NADP-dependent oxidoreductase [Kurthia huakuii]|uniref:NADP-dependent oxidoreductase n=1 Tax=Kurthia huakuii TaxID=1421019 RepID=UPI000495CA57|nr:NADP-dependent oxidoreductase [Kurthia huakuii]MBM7699646.1 NADPH:quinone reductase-like Zn-dependent oxidoreductase [Kurthia huakuii]
MKSIGFEQYGESTVLHERDIARPIPKEQQLVIETLFAAVNVYDVEVRRGDFAASPLEKWYVPGNEVVGKIVEKGRAVEAFSVGDIVIAKTARGGYAEYVAANQSHVFLKPAHMSNEQAASFSHTAVTAYWALHGFAKAQRGETVAILGASGSVGSFAIQLAKANGLHVIAVASAKNEAYVRDLGADDFVDYRKIDATFDLTADIVLDASLLGKGGAAGVRYAKDGARFIGLTGLPEQTRPLQWIDGQRTKDMTDKEAMTALEHIPLRLRTPVILPFTAAGAREAHDMLMAGTHDGKVLLRVRES